MKTTLSTILFVGMILIPNLAFADIIPMPIPYCDPQCLDCERGKIILQGMPFCQDCTIRDLKEYCSTYAPKPTVDANGEYILPDPELRDEESQQAIPPQESTSDASAGNGENQPQTVPPPVANHHRNCSTILFSNTSPNIILLLVIALCAILSFFKLRKSNS